MDKKYEPYWSDYLKQFDLPNEYFQHICLDTQKFCVIVEPRQLTMFVWVVKNFMYLLQHKQWGFIIFHGTENETFIKTALQGIPNILFENIQKDNLTISEYNDLLSTKPFWEILKNHGCEHALIFQTDVVLLRDNIDDFLEYDYVGAPWKEQIFELKVGNGGFSLRRVSEMLFITEKEKKPSMVNEDIFFSKMCLIHNFKIPSVEVAKTFSVETIYYHDPCGMHKPFLCCFPIKKDFIRILDKKIVL